MSMPRLDTDAAMSWQAPAIVRRYCSDFGRTPEDGAAGFQAFKQFMVVCAESDGARAPSEAIDDIWHTALLFTRPYREFCSEALGAYIHHEPVEDRADTSVYALTRHEAQQRFRTLDPRFRCSVDEVASCGGCASIYVP